MCFIRRCFPRGNSVQVKDLQWWGNSAAIVGLNSLVLGINYFWPKRLYNFTNAWRISKLVKFDLFWRCANLTSFVDGELFAFGASTITSPTGIAFFKKSVKAVAFCTLQVPRPWVRYLYGALRPELVEDSVTVEKIFFGFFAAFRLKNSVSLWSMWFFRRKFLG